MMLVRFRPQGPLHAYRTLPQTLTTPPPTMWGCPGATSNSIMMPEGPVVWADGLMQLPCSLRPSVRTGDLQTLFKHSHPFHGGSHRAAVLFWLRVRVRAGAAQEKGPARLGSSRQMFPERVSSHLPHQPRTEPTKPRGGISQVWDVCSVGLGGGQEMCLQGVAAWTRVGVLGNSPLWGLLVSDTALSV